MTKKILLLHQLKRILSIFICILFFANSLHFTVPSAEARRSLRTNYKPVAPAVPASKQADPSQAAFIQPPPPPPQKQTVLSYPSPAPSASDIPARPADPKPKTQPSAWTIAKDKADTNKNGQISAGELLAFAKRLDDAIGSYRSDINIVGTSHYINESDVQAILAVASKLSANERRHFQIALAIDDHDDSRFVITARDYIAGLRSFRSGHSLGFGALELITLQGSDVISAHEIRKSSIYTTMANHDLNMTLEEANWHIRQVEGRMVNQLLSSSKLNSTPHAALDLNGDGHFDEEELEVLDSVRNDFVGDEMRASGEPESLEDLMDLNGDGQVTRAEAEELIQEYIDYLNTYTDSIPRGRVVDTTGDEYIVPRDVLLLINYMRHNIPEDEPEITVDEAAVVVGQTTITIPFEARGINEGSTYHIRYWADGGGATTIPITGNPMVLEGLRSNQFYSYFILAREGGRQTVATDIKRARTLLPDPAVRHVGTERHPRRTRVNYLIEGFGEERVSVNVKFSRQNINDNRTLGFALDGDGSYYIDFTAYQPLTVYDLIIKVTGMDSGKKAEIESSYITGH